MLGSRHSAGSPGDTRAGLTSSAAGEIQYHPPQVMEHRCQMPCHHIPTVSNYALHRWLLHSLGWPCSSGGLQGRRSLSPSQSEGETQKEATDQPLPSFSLAPYQLGPFYAISEDTPRTRQVLPRQAKELGYVDLNPDPKLKSEA